jgi:hypothetical protein
MYCSGVWNQCIATEQPASALLPLPCLAGERLRGRTAQGDTVKAIAAGR